jgi:hypothetical protein
MRLGNVSDVADDYGWSWQFDGVKQRQQRFERFVHVFRLSRQTPPSPNEQGVLVAVAAWMLHELVFEPPPSFNL